MFRSTVAFGAELVELTSNFVEPTINRSAARRKSGAEYALAARTAGRWAAAEL